MKKDVLFSSQIGVDFWCIRNRSGNYWSNDFGWIELENEKDDSPYSIFTLKEKETFNLPIEGKWEKM